MGNCLSSSEQYNSNLERCICNQNNIVTYSCQWVPSESNTFEKAPHQHPQLEQYWRSSYYLLDRRSKHKSRPRSSSTPIMESPRKLSGSTIGNPRKLSDFTIRRPRKLIQEEYACQYVACDECIRPNVKHLFIHHPKRRLSTDTFDNLPELPTFMEWYISNIKFHS